MKKRNGKIKVGVLALAVQGTLVAMCAMPAHADDALPNSVEIGVLNTPRDSAKFGEYTGLDKKGGSLIGNFNLRGGDAYGDGNGTTRWSVTGTDLGLTSRNLGASVGSQGQWNLGISYDELRHNTSDSYQTPYQGTMGGNSFRLPAGFGIVAGASTVGGAGTGLTAAQYGTFQTMKINNTRENTSLTGGFNLGPNWDVKVDFNHLDQSGAKLMGFASYGTGAGNPVIGQRISILPTPMNYRTDTLTAALNWIGEKGHATGSYYGSFFRDKNNGVTFETWSAVNNIQTISTAPSNNLHQLNLTGGYAFSAKTKIAGGLSYSRNTQNSAYAFDAATMAVFPPPTNSLNGSVKTTHADLKLTDQTTRNLALSAGFKYDDRDNRTASNIYSFNAVNGGNTTNYPNTPLSIRRTNVELAGDYRLDPQQKFRLALTHDQIDRKCNQYASGGGTPAYAPGTNCVTATSTKDDKFSATYRRKVADGVNLSAGYSYSDRRTNFDQNARAAIIETGAIAGVVSPSGLNAGDYIGFHPYFEASRIQNLVKAGVNWEATDRLSFAANGRYTNDDYKQVLGVQDANSWLMNLDAAFNYMEDGVLSAYVTRQQKTRDVTDQQAQSNGSATALIVPTGSRFTNRLKDNDLTLGLGFKQGGLMGGRLEVVGDLAHSIGKTRYFTALNYPNVTTVASSLTCASPTILSCGALPIVNNGMTQFKLSGIYQLDKSAKVTLGYLYRRLTSDDFYFNSLQNNLTPTSVLPTNQQAPTYSVHALWASYTYSFK